MSQIRWVPFACETKLADGQINSALDRFRALSYQVSGKAVSQQMLPYFDGRLIVNLFVFVFQDEATVELDVFFPALRRHGSLGRGR